MSASIPPRPAELIFSGSARHTEVEPIICASAGDGDRARVTSRIPILRDVTAEAIDVEDVLASLNHFAHRSCYVFDPEARAIDTVQSVVVSGATFDADAELLKAGCRLQFLHALFHADRLQSRIGGRNADDECPVEPSLDRGARAGAKLRRLSMARPNGRGRLAVPHHLLLRAASAANTV